MTCVVIPCFNEAYTIGPLVRSILAVLEHVIVVDDGSSDPTAQEAGTAGAQVLRHEKNQGKGAAIQTGLRSAAQSGFQWALLMDGDGQHSPDDIPKFLSERTPRLVIGNRMHHPQAMPWLRRFVNRWMSARLSRRLGVTLPDTQCGFRLVHLPSWSKLNFQTRHFEVESEMIAAFIQAGHSVRFVPIQVIYKKQASKIDPLIDTLRWFRWWFRSPGRGCARESEQKIAKERKEDKERKLSPLRALRSSVQNSRAQPRQERGRKTLRVLGTVVSILALAVIIGWVVQRAAEALNRGHQRAGFGRGVLHGALMPLALPNLLVGRDVPIYAAHNSGVPYKLGYTTGVNACGAIFFGGWFWRWSRTRR